MRAECEVHVPAEVALVDDLAFEAKLDALLRDLARVEELAARPKPGARRYAAGEDRVLRAVAVIGEVDPNPVVEHPGLETKFQPFHAFGLEVFVTERVRCENALSVRAGNGIQRPQGRVDSWLLPRGAEGGAKPETVEHVRQYLSNRRFFAGDVRDARLRVAHPLHLTAERAVVVHASRSGEVEAIAPPDLLLEVEAERV